MCNKLRVTVRPSLTERTDKVAEPEKGANKPPPFLLDDDVALVGLRLVLLRFMLMLVHAQKLSPVLLD